MPEAPPTTSQEAPAKPKHSRLFRWTVRVIVIVVALWGLLTQSPLTSRFVMSRIRTALPGVQVEGDATITLGGDLKIRDLKLRVPGINSTAADVLEVRRLFLRPNLRRLLGFKSAKGPLIYSVEVDQPIVRLSQSADSGTLNIDAIERPAPSTAETLLPQIIVREGIIEFGEYWAKGPNGLPRYDPLKRIVVDGVLSNAADRERGEYELALQQTAPLKRGDKEMMGLTGRLSPTGISLSLQGVTLGDFPATSMPSSLRETFSALDLQGKVRQATFDYDEQSGIRVKLDLENVAVNLPVDAAVEPLEGPIPDSPPLRMSAVNGWVAFEKGNVNADLNGMLEDLPYHVKISYLGLTQDAPFVCDFECENFRMEEKPQILRFAPATARYRIATFGNPTGIVTTRARVTRAKPTDGTPGAIRIEGTLSFKDGVAAYERFPYQFRNLTGVVRFDDNTIDILHLEGDAPTGARVQASAHISPLTDEAKVHVEVKAQDVPLDAVFEQALGGTRKRLITEVCSTRQYERFVEAGFILSPARAYEYRQQLDEARAEFDAARDDAARNVAHAQVLKLEKALESPVFTLRGKGDVSLLIEREEGLESIWTELIDVRLGKVGVMPDRFPYPIETDGVHVLIDGETVKVGGGTWRGLGGGEAKVEASMVYPTLEQPDTDPMPHVTVEASGLPTDARLFGAIAGAIERNSNESLAEGTGDPDVDSVGGWTVHVLSELGLAGAANVKATVSSDERGTYVDARAAVADLTSTPRGAGEGSQPIMDHIGGEVLVDDDRITIDLGGRIGAREGAGAVSVKATIDAKARNAEFVGPLPEETWSANVDASGLDTSVPIEHVVRAFSPKVAGTIDGFRTKFKPAGAVDARARFSGGPGEAAVAMVDLTNAAGLSADALGGRVRTPSSEGTVRIEAAAKGVVVRARAVRAPLLLDGESTGILTLDGTWGDGDGARDHVLHVGVTGAKFESKATHTLIKERMPPGAAETVLACNPSGEFDAHFDLRSADAANGAQGEVRPRSLAVTLRGGRVNWARMSGWVEFDGASGVLHELAGRSSDDGGEWSFDAAGSWIVTDTGEGAPKFSLKADLSAEARGLPQGLLGVLPKELTDVLHDLSAKVDRTITLDRAAITFNDDGTSDGRSVSADGEVRVDGLSIDAGVPVTDCVGLLGFSVDSPAGRPATYELWSLLDSFSVSNIGLTNGRVRLIGRSGGPAVLPTITADCYGGRVSGSAEIVPGASGERRYATDLVLSGVRFAPVLRDQTGLESAREEPPTTASADSDMSRGVMDARVGLAGIVGDSSSRRGRGNVTVGGGPVVNVPLLLPLIQFSNFQLPLGESLEWATGSFYIDGPVVAFEEILVESASVQLYGYGTVTWPGMNLDMRFNSRAVHQMPVLSWVLEGVRNELISTKVGGTLGKPDINTMPLAGAGEFFSRIFSGEKTDQQKRMDDIEHRFERARDRARTGPHRAGDTVHAGEGG